MDCLLTQHQSALAQWSLSTRGKLGTGPLSRYLTFVLVDVTVEEPIEAIGDNDGYSSDCNDHTHCNTDP